MRTGRYESAKREFTFAMNNGNMEAKLDDGIKVSMEHNLQLRAHNALIKLAVLEKLEDELSSF